MKTVTLYTKESCPYCIRAKALLSSKGIPFTEHNLEGKQDELDALKKRTGLRTVPQIFIGEELIGGFTELALLESKGQLEALLG